LEALAAVKARAWEIRRIIAAEDSLSSPEPLLAQAAMMGDGLGAEDTLTALYKKLRTMVSRGGQIPFYRRGVVGQACT
jgi:hypothetical protein